MTKLGFNLHGYLFQNGVNVLRTSFQSAVEALEGDVERAKDEASGYQDFVAQTGEWIGERDEDGHVLWDQQKVLEMRVEASEEASMALRKAFVIALYHHWERSIRAWTGNDRKDHDELVASLHDKSGLAVHSRLGAVRDLVNTLKHDRDKWGIALWTSWSDVLSPSFQPRPTRTDWYGAVRLKDSHVLESFDIVSDSGPTAMSG